MKRGRDFLISRTTKEGIKISFRNKTYSMIFPRKIWGSYPNKEILMNNFIPLATISLPLIANIKKIHYNIPEPVFKEKYKQLMIKDLPSSTYDYRHQDATKMIKKFLSIKYVFEGKTKKIKTKARLKKTKHRAIIPLSLGKDSLLTLGISREINLRPVSLYINDTVMPKENKLKLKLGKKLSKELKQEHYVINNTIEKLTDFDTWNKAETSINYTHMTTGFCFIALPFIHYYGLRYIILGNQQDMNFSFKDNHGYEIFPTYDQSREWIKEQDTMLKSLVGTRVTSIIEPLTNIAIMKILHLRYPKIAKYEVSCDCLNMNEQIRWCHECSKCARLFLFMKAFGVSTKKLGLMNLFKKKHKKFYSLFKGKEVDRYEKSIEAREQQLLAFLLAIRQGARGQLIDYFRKHYLKEALAQEDELRKKYFKLWPSNIPKEIKPQVLSIYREELKALT